MEEKTFTAAQMMAIIRDGLVMRDAEIESRRNVTAEYRIGNEDGWIVYTMPDETGIVSYVMDAMDVIHRVDAMDEYTMDDMEDAFIELSRNIYDALSAYIRHCDGVKVEYAPYSDDDFDDDE